MTTANPASCSRPRNRFSSVVLPEPLGPDSSCVVGPIASSSNEKISSTAPLPASSIGT